MTRDTTLNGYIRHALEVSPRLKSLAAQAGVYNRRIPQVSSLPDPRVALSLNNLPVNSFSFTREAMTGKTLGVSQTLPFPGKLSTRGEIIGNDERIAREEFQDAQNDLVRTVRSVYDEIAFLRSAIGIEKESRDVLRNVSQVVRAKYEVSRASQQDVIKSDLEISRMTDNILTLQERLHAKEEEMNSLLLADPGREVRTDTLPSAEQVRFTVADLLTAAKAHRPFLMGLRDAVMKAEAEERLARLDRYPDFTVGASYSQRDRLDGTGVDLTDLFSLSLSMNLPFNTGGKRDAEVAEAQARRSMYTESYNSALQRLQASFAASLASLTTILARIDLLTTALLPQASQAFSASLAGYQVGDSDYLTVLDNLIKLYQLRTEHDQLVSKYWTVRADIDFQSGNDALQ